MKKVIWLLILFFVVGLSLASSSWADKMRFGFNNPTFGGNPLNSGHLLNRANMQNDYDDPDRSSYKPKTLLERFEERLMSSVLSAYARNVSGQLFDEEGNFVEGTITIGDFAIVAASDDLGGIELIISDQSSGGTTVINLPAVAFN